MRSPPLRQPTPDAHPPLRCGRVVPTPSMPPPLPSSAVPNLSPISLDPGPRRHALSLPDLGTGSREVGQGSGGSAVQRERRSAAGNRAAEDNGHPGRRYTLCYMVRGYEYGDTDTVIPENGIF
jgi:hypothetical protein